MRTKQDSRYIDPCEAKRELYISLLEKENADSSTWFYIGIAVVGLLPLVWMVAYKFLS